MLISSQNVSSNINYYYYYNQFFFKIIYRYEAPIDTAHQLAEKDLEWGATHDAWIFSILDAKQVCLFCILS